MWLGVVVCLVVGGGGLEGVWLGVVVGLVGGGGVVGGGCRPSGRRGCGWGWW